MDIVKFEKLKKFKSITHGFSTKDGGVSTGIYKSMNLSFTRGDDKEAVKENFRRITKELDMPYERLVFSAQTHTTNLRCVDERDAGKGIIRDKDYDDIDGLITDVPNLPLVTFYADCVPLVFYDPVKNVIASSHSGWRGTVKRMGLHTVNMMCFEYGCNASDIIACIGPSICKNCYEVSEDVATEFTREFSKEDSEKIVFSKENGKYLIDLQEANHVILKGAGIREENIDDERICTCCNSERFFSHRATMGQRGNLAAFIMLTERKQI